MEPSTAALETRIGQLTRELDEARTELQTRTEERDEVRRQQIATADVLKVISRSQVDLQAVFDTLVDLAARLCRAERATILRLNGDCFSLVASYGMPADYSEHMQANQIPLDRGSLSGGRRWRADRCTCGTFSPIPNLRGTGLKGLVASAALSRHR